jgi:hypothetical protein
MWGPPVIRWFINPLTIVIGTINHSYWKLLSQFPSHPAVPPGIVRRLRQRRLRVLRGGAEALQRARGVAATLQAKASLAMGPI